MLERVARAVRLVLAVSPCRGLCSGHPAFVNTDSVAFVYTTYRQARRDNLSMYNKRIGFSYL